MKRKDFCYYLKAYGSRIEAWPAETRAAALDRVQTNTDLAALLADEAAFESALHIGEVAASADFAQKLEVLSFQYPQEACPAPTTRPGIFAVLAGFLRECGIPKPAYTLTALSLLGLVMGFALVSQNSPSDVPQALLQTFFGTASVVL